MNFLHFDVPDDLVIDEVARELDPVHLRNEFERLFAELELEAMRQLIDEIDRVKSEWRFAWPDYILQTKASRHGHDDREAGVYAEREAGV